MKIIILLLPASLIQLLEVDIARSAQADSNVVTLNAYYEHTNILNYFLFGQPTNEISLGVEKRASPSNILICLVYVGSTNNSQSWVAPPNFQRVNYDLFDASNVAIPYLRTYHPINKIYNVIQEVPKNIHNVREGIMWPPFKMPYDKVNLYDMFKIENGKEYKLVVKGQIMKINNNSSLSIVELPPVSILIHIP